MAGSGNPSIMTLVGGTSTAVAGAPNVWGANVNTSAFSVTIASVVNSTATTPAWTLQVTNDAPISAITPTSSSATTFSTNSQATWFTSFASGQSSNALVNITTPVRFLTLTATAGTSSQTVTATIVQAG
jgi:hypothetical protein